MTAFYRLAAAAITAADGIVDKFVGDEAIGLFIPGYVGPDHAAKAIAAGLAILAAAGQPDATPAAASRWARASTPVRPTSAASARVCDLGLHRARRPREHDRPPGLARDPGELLLSVASAEHAGFATAGFERRTVEVRGREAGLDVYSVRPRA